MNPIESRCYALLKKKKERCPFKNQWNQKQCLFCKRHEKAKVIVRFDQKTNELKYNINQPFELDITTLCKKEEFKLSKINLTISKLSKKQLVLILTNQNIDYKGKKKKIYKIDLNNTFYFSILI